MTNPFIPPNGHGKPTAGKRTPISTVNKVRAWFTETFLEEVEEVAVAQDEFGYKKYGKYLDPMDNYDWINMATEEYVDLGKYLAAEKYRRDIVLNTMLDRLEVIESMLNEEELSIDGEININSRLNLLKKDIRKLSRNLDGREQGKASKD